MEISLEKLKRRTTCSILDYNNWDYKPKTRDLETLRKVIDIAISWMSRRGNHMSLESLETIINRETNQHHAVVLDQVIPKLRTFYYNHYKKLESPVANQRAEIEFSGDTLFTNIPIIDEKKQPEIIFLEDFKDKHIMLKASNIRFAAVWSSLLGVTDFTIKNINLKTDESLTFKPTGAYIETSRRVLKSMLRLGKRGTLIYPAEDICGNCPYLQRCLI